MKNALYLMFVASLATLSAEALASDWVPHPKDTSAILASGNEWKLISSTGISWPDGRQALVTFWEYRFLPEQEVRVIVRCHDFFNLSMQSTGAICYVPKAD